MKPIIETISFVCVVYKHPIDMVQRMVNSIDSVMQYCPFFDYEIIILENSAELISDSKIKRLELVSSKVKVFVVPGNLGYCGGNNFAIERTKNDYIIIINPDIVIENSLSIDWLVGTSKLHNCISGKLIGTPEWYTYTSSFPTDRKYKPNELPFFYDQPTLIKSGNWKVFKYIDGCFFCFSKKLWTDIGGFDENIFPGYFGENTFCFKSYLKGYGINNCNIDGLFSHDNYDSNSKQSSNNVMTWSKFGREYFYENYALSNWEKFIQYLNI